MLSNDSPEKDALAVSVIINFIDSTNRVVATQSETISAIGAGTDFYLGGSTTIPDSTPVSTLEIVTRIGGQDMAAKLSPPTSDVLVQQALYDPGWVGAVVGQITNDHPTMLLASAAVYTVVFDASGNVLGGGKGYSSTGGLLPGVRAYFSASSGRQLDPDRPSRLRRRHGPRAVRAHELVLRHGLASRTAGREAFQRRRVGHLA